MKTKIIIALATIAMTFGLTGCKPKETTLSGQVFIVTQGAENVKLGDVEILLIEKSQATDFLQNKQPTIESEMASKQEELKKIEKGEVPDVLLTNAAYAKALAEDDELQKQMENQRASMDQLVKNYSDDPKHDKVFSDATAEADSIISKETLAIGQMEVAQSAVMTNLENYPTAVDFFENFSPVISQKTVSDSDGKFSFSYPRDTSFTIFASAQRMILNKTETYYWLVDVPTGTKNAQILLSNNNLVSADPDGYFKVKPKTEIQESPDVSTQ